jgi:hypothetical protein
MPVRAHRNGAMLRPSTARTVAVAAIVATGITLAPAVAHAADNDARPVCHAGWQFDPSSHTRDQTSIDTAVAVNQSPGPIGYRFTSTKSGTTTLSASVTLGVELKAAVFASVKAEINAGISKAVTATTGVTVTGTVARGRTARGTYGVFTERIHGEKWWQTSTCGKTRSGWISVTAPYGSGWTVR